MMLLLETYTMKSPLKVELDSNESKTRVSTQISNNSTNAEQNWAKNGNFLAHRMEYAILKTSLLSVDQKEHSLN